MTIMRPEDATEELKVDPADLYREEIFTDRKAGTIRRLTPVKTDGSTDTRREVLYVGQAQLLTPVGTIPLSFEIDARSLTEALAKFAEAAGHAVDRTVEDLKEMQREAASSIVIPEVGAGGGLGGAGGVGRGGIPGGGKIKLP
jgi:hypothetical protein